MPEDKTEPPASDQTNNHQKKEEEIANIRETERLIDPGNEHHHEELATGSGQGKDQ